MEKVKKKYMNHEKNKSTPFHIFVALVSAYHCDQMYCAVLGPLFKSYDITIHKSHALTLPLYSILTPC